MKGKDLINKYSRLVVLKPWIMILLVVVLTGFFFVQSQQVQTTSQDNQDALPDDVEVIEAFEKIESKFGGSDTAKIVLYLDKDRSISQKDDIRTPDVMRTIIELDALLQTIDEIQQVQHPVDLFSSFENSYPKQERELKNAINNDPQIKSYFTDDYTMVQMNLALSGDYDPEELLVDLEETTSRITPPQGVVVKPAGEVLSSASIVRTLSSDMAKTSTTSIIGIILVLLIVFASVRFAVLPLITIGVGVLWTMGYLGIIGINLSSTTSGVISMIMGIGIDFGIQMVTRFKQEIRTNSLQKSMNKMLHAVFKPMTTTTLAAIIGFKAMGLGNITFLAEMGEIMSYGVAGCYFVALLLLPSVLTLYYSVFANKRMKKQYN
ncbi:MAG: MMPL family transporter [Nanobdellota archaeon]